MHQKNSVALNQEIRKLLTDEQKTIYDARKGKRKQRINKQRKQTHSDIKSTRGRY